jgi:hypothetical protein
MDRFDIVHADAHTVTTVNATDKADVDLVAAHCAALRSAGAVQNKDGDKLAASVPGWVINDWCTRKGITFRQFMQDRVIQDRFLMDPDNAAFRVWQGRI